MSDLVEAIDRIIAYVFERRMEIPKGDIAEFNTIAESVWHLAINHNLDRHLPSRAEQAPALTFPDNPAPCQFLSRLNLPGDWSTPDGAFMPITGEWIEQMRVVQRLVTARTAIPTPEPTYEPIAQGVATIIYHGERSYSLDNNPPINVSNEEHNALKAFLGRAIALTTESLQEAGVSNPSRVMNKLGITFPGAIRKPPRKGEGYHVRVVSKT